MRHQLQSFTRVTAPKHDARHTWGLGSLAMRPTPADKNGRSKPELVNRFRETRVNEVAGVAGYPPTRSLTAGSGSTKRRFRISPSRMDIQWAKDKSKRLAQTLPRRTASSEPRLWIANELHPASSPPSACAARKLTPPAHIDRVSIGNRTHCPGHQVDPMAGCGCCWCGRTGSQPIRCEKAGRAVERVMLIALASSSIATGVVTRASLPTCLGAARITACGLALTGGSRSLSAGNTPG